MQFNSSQREWSASSAIATRSCASLRRSRTPRIATREDHQTSSSPSFATATSPASQNHKLFFNMKTLHEYLKNSLTRNDPHPAIDHTIRAELHEDGRISFYIHAQGRDSDTVEFWVPKDDKLIEKRLMDEPLPEDTRKKVLDACRKYSGFWGLGNRNAMCIAMDRNEPVEEFIAAIETVEGVTANPIGTDGDDYYVFRPHLGKHDQP